MAGETVGAGAQVSCSGGCQSPRSVSGTPRVRRRTPPSVTRRHFFLTGEGARNPGCCGPLCAKIADGEPCEPPPSLLPAFGSEGLLRARLCWPCHIGKPNREGSWSPSRTLRPVACQRLVASRPSPCPYPASRQGQAPRGRARKARADGASLWDASSFDWFRGAAPRSVKRAEAPRYACAPAPPLLTELPPRSPRGSGAGPAFHNLTPGRHVFCRCGIFYCNFEHQRQSDGGLHATRWQILSTRPSTHSGDAFLPLCSPKTAWTIILFSHRINSNEPFQS